MLSVLLIDNFDSFSFNLVDEFCRREAAVEVWRNDLPAARALAIAQSLPEPRLVVLSPGPGAPAQAGCCIDLVRTVEQKAQNGAMLPLFGVCLGHQAIVEAIGGTVGFAGQVFHGKASRIVHDGTGIFADLPSPLSVGRYHSLAAMSVPDSLRVTATLQEAALGCDRLVMAVEHRQARIAGVQFHPESILSPQGGLLIDRVMAWAAATAT